MAAINFTLWVVDVVDLTDMKQLELAALLNVNFMQPLVGGSVGSASCRVVGTAEEFRPGMFDAVVFLTTIAFKGSGSILKRAGVSPEEATLNENLKGLTATPLPGGGISEVYWNRCELLSGVAGAIFHEACHLKFKAKRHNEMHDAVGSDGKKVWILGTNNMNAAHPNTADIEVFKSKIPNAVPLRNRLPS